MAPNDGSGFKGPHRGMGISAPFELMWPTTIERGSRILRAMAFREKDKVSLFISRLLGDTLGCFNHTTNQSSAVTKRPAEDGRPDEENRT
ncbi:hypothetical protein HPP92_002912 [Vanilla planifolia]|uniref:Uncharacterized protein n=1 Tax=Vanilla planifolia TaxID=51239 RepID=A0A835VMS8_VANPL|nr:hypothetical protein HPP92_002912 [Vanilla planifolia]